jgi:hypothetical protein
VEGLDVLLRCESCPFAYSRSSPIRSDYEPRRNPFTALISCNDDGIIRVKFDGLYRDTSTHLRSCSGRLGSNASCISG